MRRLLPLVLLCGFSSVDATETFAERVALAKKIESQKEGAAYLFGSFFPALGPAMGGIMKKCLVTDGASQEKFALVANVSLNGDLIDVDFEPKANSTATCFVKDFGTLKAPPPPICECGALPVTIDIKVKP